MQSTAIGLCDRSFEPVPRAHFATEPSLMSELAELSTVQSRKRLTTKSTASLLVLRESTLTHGPKKATRNNELTSMPPEQIQGATGPLAQASNASGKELRHALPGNMPGCRTPASGLHGGNAPKIFQNVRCYVNNMRHKAPPFTGLASLTILSHGSSAQSTLFQSLLRCLLGQQHLHARVPSRVR